MTIGVLVTLIVTLLVIGLLFWAGNALLAALEPYIAAPIPAIIRIVLVVVLVLWLLDFLFGAFGGTPRLYPLTR